MKAIIKENGEERVIKEGNLAEIKEHIINELDNLLDWLDETENNWDNFAELKNNIKEEIENAENIEDLESAFEEINSEMSWWGVYFE